MKTKEARGLAKSIIVDIDGALAGQPRPEEDRHSAAVSALQLDHEGKKSVEIALARTSIDRLLAEIRNGECVVRCANCHSIKTWERKQA